MYHSLFMRSKTFLNAAGLAIPKILHERLRTAWWVCLDLSCSFYVYLRKFGFLSFSFLLSFSLFLFFFSFFSFLSLFVLSFFLFLHFFVRLVLSKKKLSHLLFLSFCFSSFSKLVLFMRLDLSETSFRNFTFSFFLFLFVCLPFSPDVLFSFFVFLSLIL